MCAPFCTGLLAVTLVLVRSTVCTDEGIDQLAAICGVAEEVSAWFVPLALLVSAWFVRRAFGPASVGVVHVFDPASGVVDCCPGCASPPHTSLFYYSAVACVCPLTGGAHTRGSFAAVDWLDGATGCWCERVAMC